VITLITLVIAAIAPLIYLEPNHSNGSLDISTRGIIRTRSRASRCRYIRRKSPSDFDSLDDWALHSEAVNRWSNGLPPPRPKPTGEAIRPSVGTPRAPRSTRGRALKSRFVGMRMGQADFELLEELAHAHSVPVGTMARILVVRGVRAAADPVRRAGADGT
jgi:hypothetical protein